MDGEAIDARRRRTPTSAAARTRLGRAGKGLEVKIRHRGIHRIPRTLWGSAIMLFVLIAFFAGLAGDAWPRFLGMLGGATVLVALCIWALIKSPIRPHFDQRWRPRRRIAPLDLAPWRTLAEKLGGRFRARRGLPGIEVGMGGVAVRIEFLRIGGARTVATATLPRPVPTRLEVRPLRAEYHTPIDRDTGDRVFDAAFRAPCESAWLAKSILTPEVREWIRATEPEVFAVDGRKVTAFRQGFVAEFEVLRGLVELVAAVAAQER